jgi:hypothetical protein
VVVVVIVVTVFRDQHFNLLGGGIDIKFFRNIIYSAPPMWSPTNIKRITNELVNLSMMYDIVHTTKTKYTYTITVIKDGKKYIFDLPKNYPFVPPRIFINRRTYKDFVTIHSSAKIPESKIRFDKGCLCCSTFREPRNWFVRNTIQDVLAEIEQIEKLKRELVIWYIYQQIGTKYHIADEIIEYIATMAGATAATPPS